MKMTFPLAIDFGVAVYPVTAIRKRLDSRSRRAPLQNEASQRTAPQHTEKKSICRARARTEQDPPMRPMPSIPGRGTPAAPTAAPAPVPSPASAGTERRRWERVSLCRYSGLRAACTNNSQGTARVLDLGYGGVAIETGNGEPLGGELLTRCYTYRSSAGPGEPAQELYRYSRRQRTGARRLPFVT